ncbi:hypothetical protein HRI_003471300 [Hibiscus trionum]|uniref:TTF-type domain-containing protein n=1 Tax=Hibiscus trionum TaxID=183268 RepID=A0A9W7IMW9_HIBTR|nr:hypothetical protein HRI_003471300 [Hibiscus trionum]
MKKSSTIDAFFKRKNVEISSPTEQPNTFSNLNPLIPDDNPTKAQRIEVNEGFDISLLERDPGLRKQIWQYPVNMRDEIRRAYIKVGPYQAILTEYPKSNKVPRRSFQASWFKLFPSWLEYSPSKDAAFCLPCFLFHKENGPSGSNAFTVDGFQNWKKVRDDSIINDFCDIKERRVPFY